MSDHAYVLSVPRQDNRATPNGTALLINQNVLRDV